MSENLKKHESLAERLANILTKLNEGKILDIKDLAIEFNTSDRTIRRDIDRLSAANLPIVKDENLKKYYLQTYYVGKITPSDVETFAQLSGISGLYPNLNISFIRGQSKT